MGGAEHIIVDDGSTDDTPSIITEYSQSHPHIKFYRFKNNRGTNAARNLAIKSAKGEWCIILDSDDYFVDDALPFIAKIIASHSYFLHYLFAPNDMQSRYRQNAIIQGATEKTLLYPDFLNGYVNGDFVHVCNTAIIKKYPFPETLRIYEGLTFMKYYRDAQRIYFTNRVVTIRERSRHDSVTQESIRTKKIFIERRIIYGESFIEDFGQDLTALCMQRRFNTIRKDLFDNYLLLSKYKETQILNNKISWGRNKKDLLLPIINKLRLGWAYRLMLQTYLNIKYRLLKSRII